MQSNTQTYRIKHMICSRCIDVVSNVFEDNNAIISKIDLGFAEIIPKENYEFSTIKRTLESHGFELIIDKDEIICEEIKVAITKLIFHEKENENFKNSAWLEDELNISYQKLCNIFSKKTDTTIEKYIILQKLERVKELIGYNEMNFEEISKELGYKNLSHLSNQFKKLENKSLSEYKKDSITNRKRIDKLL